MAKAQVGDLIRIIDSDDAPKGTIYEVTGTIADETYVNGVFDDDGSALFFFDDEYEIFRKAGEEDSEVERIKIPIRNEVQNEPSTELSDAQMTQANRIRAACSELAELLVRKNHDYGDSFSRQYAKYGLMSALIRMDDKMRRLETLQQAESKAQVDESIGDTLLDLSGYALLAYVEETKNGKR